MRRWINVVTEALEPRVAEEFKMRALVWDIRWDYDDYEDEDGNPLPAPDLPDKAHFIINLEMRDIEGDHTGELVQHMINEYLANHYNHMTDGYRYELRPAHKPLPPEFA